MQTMLTDEQRRILEQRLRDERARAEEAVSRYETGAQDLGDRGDLSQYPLHPADLGSEAHEQEKEFLLASVESRRLAELDDALRRLTEAPDTFGDCLVCGRQIEWERLEVLPEASLCAAHAMQGERARGEEGDADPREAWREP